MAIRTALTESFGLEYPIVLAPMGPGSAMGGVGGGRLAAAVSNAGGLGLVGGGYGDPDRVRTQLAVVQAGTERPWGVGLITWYITPDVVDLALGYHPAAFLLSFGDARLYAPAIKAAVHLDLPGPGRGHGALPWPLGQTSSWRKEARPAATAARATLPWSRRWSMPSPPSRCCRRRHRRWTGLAGR